MALNEYHVLIVFCLGVAAQSAFFLRSKSQAFGALVIALLALVAAWFINEPEDRAFGVPVLWVLIYGFFFAGIYGKRIMSDITPASVIHFLMLAYFSLHLSVKASQTVMPASVLIGGLIPGLALALALAFGLARFRWVRILSYICFTIALLVTIACQWSIEDLKEIFQRSGFSLELNAYVFMGGAVFMLFFGNQVQLFLLLPPMERASTRRFWDKITGPATLHKEQRALMARKMGSGSIDAVGWLLLVLQFAFLYANERYGLVRSGSALTGSVVFVYLVVMPWEAARARKSKAAVPAPENSGPASEEFVQTPENSNPAPEK